MKKYTIHNEKKIEAVVKTISDINNILKMKTTQNDDEEIYYLYPYAHKNEDEDYFINLNLRYDLAEINPGTLNDEYYRTYGHYHINKKNNINMPELIQNIKGKMMILIQNKELTDFKAINLEEGESIILPANYAHANVNIGNEKLSFVSISSADNKHDYEIINNYHGMGLYSTVNGLEKNFNYHFDINLVNTENGKSVETLFSINENKIYDLIKYPNVLDFLSNGM